MKEKVQVKVESHKRRVRLFVPWQVHLEQPFDRLIDSKRKDKSSFERR